MFYWEDAVPLSSVLDEAGTIDGNEFLSSWRSLPQETTQRLGATVSDIEAAKAALGAARLFVLANRPVGDAAVCPGMPPCLAVGIGHGPVLSTQQCKPL